MDNLDTFKEILIKSKSLIHNNNSKLYFVYLPDYDIFRNKFHPKNHEKIIRKFVEGLDIPFISIQEKFFSNKERIKTTTQAPVTLVVLIKPTVFASRLHR